MKTSIIHSILCSALLALFHQAAVAADEKSTEKPLARQDAVLVSVTAKVSAIDPEKREVTLKGPLGNEETYIMDKRIKRLNEVKVGDLVQVDYYVSFAAELRKPTSEEKKHPITVLEAEGRASKDSAPAGGAARHLKVVATVEGLDRPTQTITVKGPMGRYVTARVADPANLTKMRIGDEMVITYTEAVAISLEKVEKKTSD